MNAPLKHKLGQLVAGVLLTLATHAAMAISPPGQVVDNIAVATYTMGGMTVSVSSNQASFTVLELVDVRVQWNDAGPVLVGSPDANKALSFKVYNLGNSSHSYVLTSTALTGQSMTPAPSSPALYVESGLEPGLQLTGANADTPLANGSGIAMLAQEAKLVYALANISAGALQDASGGLSLEARSSIATVVGKAPGTTLTAMGTSGIDLVVGRSSGSAKDNGLYTVGGAVVKTTKRVVSVADVNGGTKVKSGSVVLYEISVSAQGKGYLTDLTITDPLPSELEYVAGSLVLDGAGLSDAGRISGNSISALLGSRHAPFTSSLQFKARVR